MNHSLRRSLSSLASVRFALGLLMLAAFTQGEANETCFGPWLNSTTKFASDREIAPLVVRTRDKEAIEALAASGKHDQDLSRHIVKAIQDRALDYCADEQRHQAGVCGGKPCVAISQCVLQEDYVPTKPVPGFAKICCSSELKAQSSCVLPNSQTIRAMQAEITARIAKRAQEKGKQELDQQALEECLNWPSMGEEAAREGLTPVGGDRCKNVGGIPSAVKEKLSQVVATAKSPQARQGFVEAIKQCAFGVGDAGKAVCKEFLDKDLTDPATWNPYNHFTRFLQLAAVNAIPRAVGTFYNHLNPTDPDQVEAAKRLSLKDLIDIAEENLKRDAKFMDHEEKASMRKVLDATRHELAIYQDKKQSALNSLVGGKAAKFTINSARQAVKDATVAQMPTLGDLENEPELKKMFNALEKIIRFPIQPKKLDPNQVAQDCRKAFESRPPDYQVKMQSFAQMIALASQKNEPGRQLFYHTGEPGNGKTTGIQLLTACTKLPLCTIEADAVRERFRREGGESAPAPQPTYYTGAANTKPSKVSLASVLEQMVVECIKEKFIDPSTGLPVTNGTVLLDDIDRVMKVAGADDRNEIIEFFKKLADPALRTFRDHETGHPLNAAWMNAFVTSNRLPAEFKMDAALMSRYERYAVPYPGEVERTNYVHLAFENFMKTDVPKLDGHPLADWSRCPAKLEEVIKFDMQRFKDTGNRAGMRGLEKLTALLIGHMAGRVSDLTAASVNRDPCSGFLVSSQGFNLGHYTTPVSEELMEDDFENEVRVYRYEVQDLTDKIESPEVRKYLQDQYQILLGEDVASRKAREHAYNMKYAVSADKVMSSNVRPPDPVAPLGERRKSFEELKSVIRFALDRKDFRGREGEIKKAFDAEFKYLPKNSDQRKQLQKVSNGIMLKLTRARPEENKDKAPLNMGGMRVEEGGGINSVVVVQRQNLMSDLSPIYSLAKVFGVPVCELKSRQDIVKKIVPAWKAFQTPPSKGDSYYVANAPDGSYIGTSFSYRPEHQLYIGKLSQGGSIGSYNEQVVYDPKTDRVAKLPDSALTEPEKTEFNFTESCMKQLREARHPSQAFVVLDLPNETEETVNEIVAKALNDLNQKGPAKSGQNIWDLSQMTVFVAPKDKSVASKVKAPQGKFGLLTDLEVVTLRPEDRQKKAEIFKQEILAVIAKGLGKDPSEIQFNKQEQRLFKLIVDWDRERAKAVNGLLGVENLQMAVIHLCQDVSARYSNQLGFKEGSRSANDVVAQLENLYKLTLPAEIGEKLGQRRKELEAQGLRKLVRSESAPRILMTKKGRTSVPIEQASAPAKQAFRSMDNADFFRVDVTELNAARKKRLALEKKEAFKTLDRYKLEAAHLKAKAESAEATELALAQEGKVRELARALDADSEVWSEFQIKSGFNPMDVELAAAKDREEKLAPLADQRFAPIREQFHAYELKKSALRSEQAKLNRLMNEAREKEAAEEKLASSLHSVPDSLKGTIKGNK